MVRMFVLFSRSIGRHYPGVCNISSQWCKTSSSIDLISYSHNIPRATPIQHLLAARHVYYLGSSGLAVQLPIGVPAHNNRW